MKFKFLNLSFLMLLLTNMLMFISNSWFMLWMIMEINLICFLKILSSNNKFPNEILMNYFLMSSFSAYLMIFSLIMMNFNFISLLMNFIILLSLINKLGMPPFFSWYLKMMMNIECWLMFFINSCLQKFIPLMTMKFLSLKMINFNSLLNLLMFMLILSIIMITPFSALNSLNLWMIMSMSSMIQMSWIIMMIFYNDLYWLLFFILYSMISFSLMMVFKMFNINHLTEIFNLKIKKNSLFYLINLNMLSLAGLPPFIGFLNKFIFIWNLMKMNIFLINMIIFMSLINLFFYTRIMYASFLNNFHYPNYLFKQINSNFKNYLSIMKYWNLSILGIMMMEFI